jgi:FkbM family methyltransferase
VTTLEYLVNVKKLTSACLDRSLFTCDNWRRYALDFLSLGGPDQYALRFDNDLRVLLRPNTTDKWVVQETMLRDDYRLRDMDLRQATVIDLGANIGVVSLRAAALGAARVFAYEPEPSNYELLTRNVAGNRFQSVIRTFDVACTDQESSVKLHLSSANVAGHSMYGGSGESIAVQSTTLARILETHAIATCDLLKIDVEGSEFPILYTLPTELFSRIKRIYLECHPSATARHNGADLTKYLEQQGYAVEVGKSADWRISRLYCRRG